MNWILVLAIAAVVVVLVFDYTNGFHDAANIVATMIASRAMLPAQAVLVVGLFEFLGPLLGGTAVANTIGTFIDLDGVDPQQALLVLLCGLLGAIAWNLLTWWKGIPSSSSHALVGGLVGAVVVSTGLDHVVWGFHELFAKGHVTGVTKVLLALVMSPLLGFWVAFVVHKTMTRLLAGAHPRVNDNLRRAQFVTAASLAFSHGANDAQKSMGILTLVLLLGGFIQEFAVPFWVMLSCAVAITLGIVSGGWRIVRTLGFAIYRVRPLHALDSQMTSAAVIFGASMIGAPVSTTHVVATSIMGVGYAERPKAVKWGKAGEIAMTWIITIPSGAMVAVAFYYLARLLITTLG
jgi:PiT family inorganic phosphate transporter